MGQVAFWGVWELLGIISSLRSAPKDLRGVHLKQCVVSQPSPERCSQTRGQRCSFSFSSLGFHPGGMGSLGSLGFLGFHSCSSSPGLVFEEGA